ncbi:hypothetical protein ACHAW6_005774 [Cyclotella cf. meneghiniana]
MLSKPGEARSKAAASTSSTRRRKVVEENLEDVVRKLQRLPCNKVCADCQSKLPQCVNLSHGTFICMACSGVHREFSHKIKGIGHSSFTPEEVAMLRLPHSGNEAVNARYLAKYSSSHDRIKPPKDNSDLHALRAWIQRKYIDKAWLRDLTGSADEGGAPPKQLPAATPQTAPPGRRKILPNVSSGATAHAQSGDLFGFDSIVPSSSSAGNESWDAFGSSSLLTNPQPQVDAKPQAFADFGSASSFQPDFGVMNENFPPAAPTSSFPTEFGTTSWQSQAQQPTVVALPPPLPAGRESFANFDPPQAQQPSFETNFALQQPMFSANFDQTSLHMQPAPKGDAHTHKDVVTTTTPNRVNQSSDNFQPNFDQITMSNQRNLSLPQTGVTQPPNNNKISMTNLDTDNFGTFEANCGDADSAFPVQQTFGGGMNFGDFVQPQGMNVETSLQQQLQQQPSTIPQMNTLPGGGMMKQQQGHVDSNIAHPTVNKPTDISTPTMLAHQQDSNPASPPLNPNAFRSVEEDKLSAFDAFEGLSLEPTPVLMESSEANSGVAGVMSHGGDSSGQGMADSMAHMHDALKMAKLQETVMMLHYLSVEQLIQVQQSIASFVSIEHDTMSHSCSGGAMNGQGITGSNPVQHPVSGMGSVGLNGMVSSNPNMSMPMGGAIHFDGQPSMPQFQQFSSQQIQPMGMGINMQNDKMPEPSATNFSVPAALPPVEKEGNPFDMY